MIKRFIFIYENKLNDSGEKVVMGALKKKYPKDPILLKYNGWNTLEALNRIKDDDQILTIKESGELVGIKDIKKFKGFVKTNEGKYNLLDKYLKDYIALQNI